MIYTTAIDSPVGRLSAYSMNGALCGLYLSTQRSPHESARHDPARPVLEETTRQLAEYFDGRRQRFELPLSPLGTPFQRSVWHALGRIPFGTTKTYGELANTIGRPTAARAVGASNGKNPISIVIPCHRVLGKEGALTGYAGGLEAKRWLLAHEARLALQPHR